MRFKSHKQCYKSYKSAINRGIDRGQYRVKRGQSPFHSLGETPVTFLKFR